MYKYGFDFPEGMTDVEIELLCMANRRGVEQGGIGAYRHWRNAVKLMYPQMAMHDWLDWRAERFFEYDYNYWAGCATAGKSHDAVFLAATWWLGCPTESAVVLTSTTRNSIRRRLWPILQDLRLKIEKVQGSPLLAMGFPGNMIDSRTMLQAQKGDDKHAIAAIAVAEGGLTKAVSDIKGFHPKRRLLVIIDEANDTPEAIFASIPNLKKGLREFKLIVIGNPVSRLDPHGRVCEPSLGWNSVTIEDEEWETKPVSEWEVESGVCLRFDGEKSPNIKAGEDKWPFLFGNKDLRKAQASGDYEDHIWYWSNTRGFWPPDGICNTIFTDGFIVKYRVRDSVIFLSKSINLAGLDPSFSADGDGCILRFGKLGDLEGGKMCLLTSDRVKIKLKAGQDIWYQIAEKTVEECQKRGMSPNQLGVDTTGGGGAVADIICRIWGDGVNRVGFGEKASDLPASADDLTPGHEAYYDRVTELWFKAREFAESGQLKVLDIPACKEFCSRTYTTDSRKKRVLPKKDCKKLLGHSPDDADAVTVLLDTARRNGLTLNTVRTRSEQMKQRGWDKMAARLNNAIFEEAA